MITKELYTAAVAVREAAEKLINAYHQQRADDFNKRYSRFQSGESFFIDDELIYAARNRCHCGHGLAYPKECGANHYWDCAAILKGIADKTYKHTDKFPFAFYEIKSEQQPSACGETTRGNVIPNPNAPRIETAAQ